MGATTSGDIAQQPSVIGDTQKRDPMKNVKKNIKSFKKWRKDKDLTKITSKDEVND